jgi:hypothetical protein
MELVEKIKEIPIIKGGEKMEIPIIKGGEKMEIPIIKGGEKMEIPIIIRPFFQKKERKGEYVLYQIEIIRGGLILNNIYFVLDGYGKITGTSFIDFLFQFKEKDASDYRKEGKPLPLYSWTYYSIIGSQNQKLFKHITTTSKKFYYPMPFIFFTEDFQRPYFFEELKEIFPFRNRSKQITKKRLEKVIEKIIK